MTAPTIERNPEAKQPVLGLPDPGETLPRLAWPTVLLIVGTLNIIYGIGALDDANIFVNQKRYIFTNLNTMGWVLIILGIIQLTGGFSLLAGNIYGRVIGIIGGSLGAIAALFSIGGNDPWWSLAIFFLSVWVVYGIFIYGADERAARA